MKEHPLLRAFISLASRRLTESLIRLAFKIYKTTVYNLHRYCKKAFLLL
jgi:hypothetical protein